MPVDALCVGHATCDLSLFVDRFPEQNSKCETEELLETGGGPAANAAYLLSTWGVRTAFAGLIGDDRFGGEIQDQFRSAGTDLGLIEVRPGHVTPVSVILIDRETGSRTIVNHKRKSHPFRLDEQALAACAPRILLLDGHELEASLAALRAFPEAISILDAGSWREGTAQLASQVTCLAASERFARQATGLESLDQPAARAACLAKLRELYPLPSSIIVTLGEHGLLVESGAITQHMPAFPAQAVDTTGAGDIFHGALAYAFWRNMPLVQSLQFASMAASLSVSVRGGRQSIPKLSQVEQALRHVEQRTI